MKQEGLIRTIEEICMSNNSVPNASPRDLSPEFWEGRYQEGTDRWDLGQPAPPFISLLQSQDVPEPGRMAVLGSGKGHDALWFASQGFEVIGFDFAPSAIAESTAAAQARGLSAQFLQRDIFALPQEFAETFNYVLEHTCYCAILPSQRAAYVSLVRSLLKPGGELIALFWAHSQPGGPPFGTTVAEIRQQFEEAFAIESLQLAIDSVPSRQNEEYLGRFRVKA
jgi:SAM-dependent methyltransferase